MCALSRAFLVSCAAPSPIAGGDYSEREGISCHACSSLRTRTQSYPDRDAGQVEGIQTEPEPAKIKIHTNPTPSHHHPHADPTKSQPKTHPLKSKPIWSHSLQLRTPIRIKMWIHMDYRICS